ncbi:MAG: MBOAT family O-acyltransferase [Planctomycetota bacterium]
MLFHSLDFVFFIVAFAAMYTLVASRVKIRNLLLLLASHLFYGWWDARFLSLLVLSTLVDYGVGCYLGRDDQAQNSKRRQRRRKLALGISILTNLGVLGTFKYFGFFYESFSVLLAAVGLPAHPLTLKLILPVGISFYTFQTLSYTIDVYRGSLAACRDPVRFGVYVAFFPQLVAGPIERASDLLPQLATHHRPSHDEWLIALWWVLLGYFKKIYVADNLAATVDPIFAEPNAFDSIQRWLALLGFAFQIYADFSGYSDIARGLAMGMGFRLSPNFCLPYFAASPREFWQRWHITLSRWLRDYVYIPLGGNRGGPVNTARNLMLTMMLGGLWHGAAWTFVLWGIFHGTFLIGDHFVGFDRGPRKLRVLVLFGWTLVSWALFRSPDLATCATMLSPISDVSFDAPAAIRNTAKWCMYIGPLFLLEIWMARRQDMLVVLKQSAWIQGGIFFVMLMLIAVLGSFGPTSFLYFQF